MRARRRDRISDDLGTLHPAICADYGRLLWALRGFFLLFKVLRNLLGERQVGWRRFGIRLLLPVPGRPAIAAVCPQPPVFSVVS